MKGWWSGLAFRERVILSLALLTVMVIFVDTFVVQGINSQSKLLDEKIEQAREDLIWMRSAVNRLPDSTKPVNKVSSGRIVNFIDRQISKQGLKKNMLQMTPVKDHSVRLKLTDVDFNRLLNFFTAIEKSVFIQEVRLLPGESQGIVNASLLLSNVTDKSGRLN